jgi:hypothetical protein
MKQKKAWMPASYPGPLTSRDFILTEMASLTQIEIMKKVRHHSTKISNSLQRAELWGGGYEVTST